MKIKSIFNLFSSGYFTCIFSDLFCFIILYRKTRWTILLPILTIKLWKLLLLFTLLSLCHIFPTLYLILINIILFLNIPIQLYISIVSQLPSYKLTLLLHIILYYISILLYNSRFLFPLYPSLLSPLFYSLHSLNILDHCSLASSPMAIFYI